MSDTEILMRLQKDVSEQTGMMKEFIKSQEHLNQQNQEDHQILFRKVDWLYLKVGGILGGIAALTWLAERVMGK